MAINLNAPLLKQAETYKKTHRLPDDYPLEQILIGESLIRRVAMLNLPLMLKGSFATRQFLNDSYRLYRIPADLDWVGLDKINEEKLTRWMITATELQIDDGVNFRSFQENSFWRMIEYAMAEDFPTVNTDLQATIEPNQTLDLHVDISFNLPIPFDITTLDYKPVLGDDFPIYSVCPLELQIAWKLHQTITRPRFKDLVDICWLLLSNPSYNFNWDEIMETVEDECKIDTYDYSQISTLKFLLKGELNKHPAFKDTWKKHTPTTQELWAHWCSNTEIYPHQSTYLCSLTLDLFKESFLSHPHLSTQWAQFHSELLKALKQSGFTDWFTHHAK